MINHARTLLLNQQVDPGELGGEFIPPEFRPVTLPGPLQAVRRLLFGTRPDALKLNYRVAQFLGVLHAGRFSEYVTALDSRVTYRQFRDDLFAMRSEYQVAGDKPQDLVVLGPDAEETAEGVLRWTWQVSIPESGVAVLTLQDADPVDFELEFDIENGITSPLLLPAVTNAVVRIQNPEVGDRWTITQRVRPRQSLGTLVQYLQITLTPDSERALFGAAVAEPYQTFRNLWASPRGGLWSLTGLLLALIYRTEEHRA